MFFSNPDPKKGADPKEGFPEASFASWDRALANILPVP